MIIIFVFLLNKLYEKIYFKKENKNNLKFYYRKGYIRGDIIIKKK
jgi:hypothetical protein